MRYPVNVTTDLDSLLNKSFDFAVVSMPSNVAPEYCEKLLSKGIPVLMETPPALSFDELQLFWDRFGKYQDSMQIAEVYHRQPYLASIIKLVEEGIIGETQALTISMLHGYHCFSIVRRILNTGMCNAKVFATRKEKAILQTCEKGRGLIENSGYKKYSGDTYIVEFENGKILTSAYSKEQYFSTLRFRWFYAEGDRGAMINDDFKYFSDEEGFMQSKILRTDFGSHGTLIGNFHYGYSFNGSWIYKNPFPGIPYTDDEIAVASGLIAMKDFVDTGIQSYSIQNACQDNYLSLLVDKAAEENRVITSETQSWGR